MLTRAKRAKEHMVTIGATAERARSSPTGSVQTATLRRNLQKAASRAFHSVARRAQLLEEPIRPQEDVGAYQSKARSRSA